MPMTKLCSAHAMPATERDSDRGATCVSIRCERVQALHCVCDGAKLHLMADDFCCQENCTICSDRCLLLTKKRCGTRQARIPDIKGKRRHLYPLPALRFSDEEDSHNRKRGVSEEHGEKSFIC